jgi:hypothetical protein
VYNAKETSLGSLKTLSTPKNPKYHLYSVFMIESGITPKCKLKPHLSDVHEGTT